MNILSQRNGVSKIQCEVCDHIFVSQEFGEESKECLACKLMEQNEACRNGRHYFESWNSPAKFLEHGEVVEVPRTYWGTSEDTSPKAWSEDHYPHSCREHGGACLLDTVGRELQ